MIAVVCHGCALFATPKRWVDGGVFDGTAVVCLKRSVGTVCRWIAVCPFVGVCWQWWGMMWWCDGQLG